MTNDVRSYVTEHHTELLADLDTWLRIRGISAQPQHHPEVLASAEWFADACRKTGFPTVEIWPTAGLPAVFAEWPSGDPDAPTVLVYGHHDVQPVDPIELWHTDPFDPTIDGDLLRARGASDDKGQLLFHLLGLRAHLAVTGRATPAVNLKFLIEGEEESGSPNFKALLTERRHQLDCDVVVVTDTGMLAPNIPSAVTGMRGLAVATVHFHGPDLDLHSGSFGGAIPNPATAIARLAAALHDENGRVQVPGYYDDVLALTETEQQLLQRVPFDEKAFLTTTKSRALAGEAGYSTLERLGARPTAEVNGIGGGYQGAGGKTIVPSDAFVKLSFRMVANQSPAKVCEAVNAFVADHTPEGITHQIEWEGDGTAACLVDIETPAFAALSRAICTAFDADVVLPTREGGSGPEAIIQKILAAPMVFLGVGLPDDQIHAPNEKVNLSMLYKGAEAAAHLWTEFAAVGAAGLKG
ncbi:MAG: dipeptidase [Actinomycetota bacterium]|nr:dipeptidase [Actinomycetota bacterium]MDQ2959015.1 dipeptidase [Actinomycetota bacterium]